MFRDRTKKRSTQKGKDPMPYDTWIFRYSQPVRYDERRILYRWHQHMSNIALLKQVLRQQLSFVQNITVLGTTHIITY